MADHSLGASATWHMQRTWMNSKMGATIAIDVDTFTWESARGACVCACAWQRPHSLMQQAFSYARFTRDR